MVFCLRNSLILLAEMPKQRHPDRRSPGVGIGSSGIHKLPAVGSVSLFHKKWTGRKLIMLLKLD